jgi:3-hydroxyacyl-CoA dehydrogenase/enoyl-CoA hydratase/3-hydroxybutyryl-CoA epimerase
MITYTVVEGAAILTWEMPGQPVNVMNDESLALFVELIERAAADDDVRGIVITSTRRDFVVGADLKTFLSDRTPSVIFGKNRKTQAILRRLETIGKPVCAAINGSALGGGMEIALASHYRIAADIPTLRLGLPEVTLGLLAGAGGTQRLPRLLGLRKALPLLLDGTTLGVHDAHRIGMIDEVVAADKLLDRALAWLASHTGPAAQAWDREGYHLPDGPFEPEELCDFFASETAKVAARTHNNLPAPAHILSAVFEGCLRDIDTGLKGEARHFASCVSSSASDNIIRTSFFGVADAAKLKIRPKDVPTLKLDRIGVFGTSPMARGLVLSAVRRGLEVLWFDKASAGPKNWLAGDHIDAELATKVSTVNSERELACCQVVINVSGQPVETIAPLIAGPDSEDPILTIGLHGENTSFPIEGLYVAFAVSPQDTRLIEIMRGSGVSDNSLAHAMDFAKRIGKVPVVVAGTLGSYVQRVHSAYATEYYAMLAEGVTPALVRNAARQSGMGTIPSEEMAPMSSRSSSTSETAKKVDLTSIGSEFATLKTRLLNAQVVEAMHCLEQRVISSPIDADVAASLGWGFPKHLGGPFGLVDTLGAQRFAEQCDELVMKYGSRFKPPKMFEDHIKANTLFYAK